MIRSALKILAGLALMIISTGVILPLTTAFGAPANPDIGLTLALFALVTLLLGALMLFIGTGQLILRSGKALINLIQTSIHLLRPFARPTV